MSRKQNISLILIAAGLLLSLLLNFAVMYDCVPFKPNYVLYIHLFLILALRPVALLTRGGAPDVYIENTFKTALKVLPPWMLTGLGAILIYSVIVFVNFTYIHKPLEDKPDIDRVVMKFNKGSSAATMFFYAATFGMMNLQLRVKKLAEEEAANESQEEL